MCIRDRHLVVHRDLHQHPVMTVLVAANVTAAGASLSLDLSEWAGQRTREVMWGCEFPPASPEWFVNLPPYGFNWWLIGEVDAEA